MTPLSIFVLVICLVGVFTIDPRGPDRFRFYLGLAGLAFEAYRYLL
jgi:hypothetical protein